MGILKYSLHAEEVYMAIAEQLNLFPPPKKKRDLTLVFLLSIVFSYLVLYESSTWQSENFLYRSQSPMEPSQTQKIGNTECEHPMQSVSM